LGHVKAGEAATFAGKTAQVRGFDLIGAEGGNVRVAEVIRENQYDVGGLSGGGGSGKGVGEESESQNECEKK
jgi:hypothetical protein